MRAYVKKSCVKKQKTCLNMLLYTELYFTILYHLSPSLYCYCVSFISVCSIYFLLYGSIAENKYSKQKWKKRNDNTAKQTRRISATFDIGNCRMTNYELLRWLVETPSRDVEHYRMINASRSTGSHYNDARHCLCHTSQPIRHNKGVNLRAVTQWRHSLQRYQHATTMVNYVQTCRHP